MKKGFGWDRFGRTRAAWLSASLLVFVALLLLRDARGAEGWGGLLAEHGIKEVVRLDWLYEAEPGQWTLAVAEGLVEGSEGREVFAFEGMTDGQGRPYRVRRVGNLTQTPDADDAVLAIDSTRGRQLVATSSAFGGSLTSVALLDLRGDPSLWRDEAGARRPLGDGFKLAFASWQEMSRAEGVQQRSFVFTEAISGLEARFDGDHLIFAGQVRAEGGVSRQAWSTVRVLDGAALDVHGSSLGLVAQSEGWAVDSWVQFAVNRARANPIIGPLKIALLEKYVFDHVDAARKGWRDAVGGSNEALVGELDQEHQQRQQQATAQQALEARRDSIVLEGLDQWPPVALASPAARWGGEAVPGEGEWSAWIPEFIDLKAYGDRPWPVYRTAIRVNFEQRYDPVSLIAMDLRQLDLHLVAGIISPRSTTGYKGTGLIPRDPEVLKRVLVAFNGGFKTTHGAYGVLLDRKLFVPHKPAMATLAIYEDKAVRMGTWPGKGNFGNYGEERRLQQTIEGKAEEVSAIPSDVVDLRQNLPPLVAGGKLNPSGAVRWGGVVDHLTSANTPRSGVCIKGEHTLIFIWGKRCGAADLGEAMIAAGCDYGMHLDMNPYHTGLSMIQIPLEGGKIPPEGKERRLRGALAEKGSRLMDFDMHRYAGQDIKDFFYLTWRDNLPRRLGQPEGFGAWSARGLPVAAGGVEPLALQSHSEDELVTMVAVDARHFKAAGVAVPEGAPAEGEVGEVQIGVWLDGAAPQGAERGRIAARRDDLRLVVEGVESPGERVTPLAPGAALFVNGARVDSVPVVAFERPVVAAQTLSGDVVLLTCRRCGLDRLMTTLEVLDVDAAILLGEGGLEALAFGKVWKAAHTDAPRQTPAFQIQLRPRPLRPRSGVTGFDGPLASGR